MLKSLLEKTYRMARAPVPESSPAPAQSVDLATIRSLDRAVVDLRHPISGEQLTLVALLPQELEKFLSSLDKQDDAETI